MFTAIRFEQSVLHLIDQTSLPLKETWIPCRHLEEVAQAIETMVVRGAPAIAIAAGFGLVLAVQDSAGSTWGGMQTDFAAAVKRLRATRPTAVNLFHAMNHFSALAATFNATTDKAIVLQRVRDAAHKYYEDDVEQCHRIGEFGARLATSGKPLTIITHCNTGALATAGFGTALGVIRALHQRGLVKHVFADETRPFLQGSRLTAFELEKENIPYSIQVDGAAAFNMAQRKVDWVIVGADRIAANGDTANKIGTYHLAIAARYHQVKFIVAAPSTTFDINIATGQSIPVEERAAAEITEFRGVGVSPAHAKVYNPSFDVTPASLIDAIVTEKGVIEAPFTENIRRVLNS